MKVKKLLCIVLATVMLLATMSFQVLAEGPPTVSVWEDEPDISWYNTQDDDFELDTAEDLAGLAVLVNGGTDSFAKKTVTIKEGIDIDLDQVDWTPIGTSSNPFLGTFDGGGNTIYNLWGAQDANGLFGYTSSGNRADGWGNEAIIKNFTIDGVFINDANQKHNGVGAVVGCGNMYTTIKDVNVVGQVIVTGQRAGGILGYAYSAAVIDNCHVDGKTANNDSKITALYWACGGIQGFAAYEGSTSITNCTVKNIDIHAELCNAAAILGNAGYGKVENVVAENVDITADEIYYKDENAYLSVGLPATGNSIAINVTLTVGGQPVAPGTDVVVPVAMVGDKYYGTIDEAVANWTDGTTLTLLSDVTLSDVIRLKASETYTLDLGKYTMTGKRSSNAIEIEPQANDDAGSLTVNATEGGGITSSKACIAHLKPLGSNITANPITININGGIFNGTNAIEAHGYKKTGKLQIVSADKGFEGQGAPHINIYDGVFNASIYTDRAKVKISGGTFNKSFTCSVDSTADMTISGGRFVKGALQNRNNSYLNGGIDEATDGTDLAPLHKWTFGSSSGVYDRNIYVDADGYLVVTDEALDTDDFEAYYLFDFEAMQPHLHTSWSTNVYASFKYSKISSEYGNKLYFKNASDAIKFSSFGTPTLLDDYSGDINEPSTTIYKADYPYILDVTGKAFTGTVYLNNTSSVFHIKTTTDDDSTYKVVPYSGYMLKTEEIDDKNTGVKIIKYSSVKDTSTALATVTTESAKTYYFATLNEAVQGAKIGSVVTLLDDVSESVVVKKTQTASYTQDGITIDLNTKTLTGDINVESGAVVKVKNGNIVNNNSAISALKTSGTTTLENVNIVSAGNAASVDNGDLSVLSGVFNAGEGYEAVSVINNGTAALSGGDYSSNVSAYAAEGYDVVRTATHYTVIREEEQADSISVEYKNITDEDAEGEKVYEIVVKANKGDVIHELASVDLTFVYTKTPVKNGAIDFTVAPASDFTMSRYEKTDRYMFNYNGSDAYQGTSNAITVGTITVTGYGKYSIVTAEADTNIVNATTVFDNLVDSYTDKGAEDSDATTGALIINEDTVEDDGLVGKITDDEIAIPVRTLTVNVKFPNAVANKDVNYQDMRVEITGNFDGENKTVTYVMGDGADEVQWVNDAYVLREENLVLNNSYTVAVYGAGYRTARYTVTMTENKTLNFWNNVMTNKQFVEEKEDSSKTTKNFLAGDIVKDNKINIYDLSAVVSYFGEEGLTAENHPEYAKYDLNRDGKIDSKDVAYVLVSWGE